MLAEFSRCWKYIKCVDKIKASDLWHKKHGMVAKRVCQCPAEK